MKTIDTKQVLKDLDDQPIKFSANEDLTVGKAITHTLINANIPENDKAKKVRAFELAVAAQAGDVMMLKQEDIALIDDLSNTLLTTVPYNRLREAMND